MNRIFVYKYITLCRVNNRKWVGTTTVTNAVKNATHSRRVLIVVGSDRNGIATPPPPETSCALVSHMRLGGDRVYRYRGITHIFIPALYSHDDVRQSAIRIPRTDSSWRRQIFRRWFMMMVIAPETHWPKLFSRRRNRNIIIIIIIIYYCIVLFRVCRRGTAYLCALQVLLVSYVVWNGTIIMYGACPPTGHFILYNEWYDASIQIQIFANFSKEYLKTVLFLISVSTFFFLKAPFL